MNAIYMIEEPLRRKEADSSQVQKSFSARSNTAYRLEDGLIDELTIPKTTFEDISEASRIPL